MTLPASALPVEAPLAFLGVSNVPAPRDVKKAVDHVVDITINGKALTSQR